MGEAWTPAHTSPLQKNIKHYFTTEKTGESIANHSPPAPMEILSPLNQLLSLQNALTRSGMLGPLPYDRPLTTFTIVRTKCETGVGLLEFPTWAFPLFKVKN